MSLISENEDQPRGDAAGTGSDDAVRTDPGHHHGEGAVRETLEDRCQVPQGARQLDERAAAQGQRRGRG